MKKIIKILVGLVILFSTGYAVLVFQNNRDGAAISDEQVRLAYERGVTWLVNNREAILSDGNPMLWWMLGESARITGDARVKALFTEFVGRFDRSAPYSVWQAFFHPGQFRNARFSSGEYAALVEYQQYFLYGLTCSAQLAQEPSIQQQNDPGFCWQGARAMRPACVTHQLMGYRMLKRNTCDVDNIDSKISVLQDAIVKQLTYDPRVVDVYLQRVLMLVESGARHRVNSRWLQRVIDAQREDGGWSDVQPLVVLGGGRNLGFGANGFAFANPASNFHATAQGVLLMSLLKE